MSENKLKEENNSMQKLIIAITKNRVASWIFSFSMGVMFRYIYGFAKDYLWSGRGNFISLDSSIPEPQILILTISLNSVVALTSSLVASIICGAILVYVLSGKALFYSIPAITAFLVLSPRFWRFWMAPDLGMQISVLIGPIMASLVFVGTVLIFLKILAKRRETTR